jgi:hypothetical protein
VKTPADIHFKLRELDRRLGAVVDLPHMQKAPAYVRSEITEIRDELMKASQWAQAQAETSENCAMCGCYVLVLRNEKKGATPRP